MQKYQLIALTIFVEFAVAHSVFINLICDRITDEVILDLFGWVAIVTGAAEGRSSSIGICGDEISLNHFDLKYGAMNLDLSM